MPYSLLKCTFTTPVHFGVNHMGNALQETEIALSADALYSALCLEAVRAELLPQLESSVAQDGLRFSDLMPYRQDELYLPKPILWQDREKEGGSSLKKAMKRLRFIPGDLLAQFLKGVSEETLNGELWSNHFGVHTIRQQVALLGQEQSRPYQIGIYTFLPSCGLYCIVAWKTESEKQLFTQLIDGVSYGGIGGKRSSGLGKFTWKLSDVPTYYRALLEDRQAPWQMLICPMLPPADRLPEVLDKSWYQLIRRGGYVYSQTYAKQQVKKRTVYLLQSGSCLPYREDGSVLDVGGAGAHPVWRYAKGLYVGVRL